jgi:predicted aspartyl protease
MISFRRAGNLILIQARADTTNGNFILDTGAPSLVLNITYFRNYPSVLATAGGGITGSVPAVAHTTVGEFSFGTIKYRNVQANVINLGHIEDTRGMKIFGLLGVNLFKQFEMIIDYKRSVIYLHLIRKKEAATYKSEMLKDTVAYNTFPIDITENKILTRAEVSGKRLNLILDTGAESNVLDSRLPNKIFENVTINRRVTLSGSGSEKVEALYGDLKNLKIGNKTMETFPLLITNLEQMCLAYDYCIDGMLGFDFLSQHKIGFNFVKREMYLWK